MIERKNKRNATCKVPTWAKSQTCLAWGTSCRKEWRGSCPTILRHAPLLLLINMSMACGQLIDRGTILDSRLNRDQHGPFELSTGGSRNLCDTDLHIATCNEAHATYRDLQQLRRKGLDGRESGTSIFRASSIAMGSSCAHKER